MSAEEQSLNTLFQTAATEKGPDILFADEVEHCPGQLALHSVQVVAGGLSNLGIRRQDRVAFLCDSSVRHVLSFFACQLIGAVTCALHTRSTASNIAEALQWLEVTALIVDNKYRQLVLDALALTNLSVPVVILDSGKTGNNEFDYNELARSEVRISELPSYPLDEPAMIILSSGTTGAPKGIVHSQKTLYESAVAGVQVFGDITPEDSVVVAMAPSFAAWNHVIFAYLACQAKIVFNRGFDAVLYIDTINKERVTHAPLVPTAWRRVLGAIQGETTLPSLHSVFFSGEPGTSDFIRLIKDKLPSVKIRSAYLSSEGGDASATVADNDLLQKEKIAAGRMIAGADLRIIDPEGGVDDVLKQGEIGEIVVRSASIALGYWKNNSLTQERFVDGWWRSGDLGFIDAEGRLNIAGRNDNMIITGGLKVHAEEVEAALMQHPAVSLAAIVGKPDAEWGQRIEAFVVSDRDLSQEEIISYCRERALLSPFKLPKQIHFRDSLPTGATGKIYRRGLLEAAT